MIIFYVTIYRQIDIDPNTRSGSAQRRAIRDRLFEALAEEAAKSRIDWAVDS